MIQMRFRPLHKTISHYAFLFMNGNHNFPKYDKAISIFSENRFPFHFVLFVRYKNYFAWRKTKKNITVHKYALEYFHFIFKSDTNIRNQKYHCFLLNNFVVLYSNTVNRKNITNSPIWKTFIWYPNPIFNKNAHETEMSIKNLLLTYRYASTIFLVFYKIQFI